MIALLYLLLFAQSSQQTQDICHALALGEGEKTSRVRVRAIFQAWRGRSVLVSAAETEEVPGPCVAWLDGPIPASVREALHDNVMRYDLRGVLFDVIIEGVAERARGFRRVQGQPFANGFGADGVYEYRFVVKKWRVLLRRRPR